MSSNNASDESFSAASNPLARPRQHAPASLSVYRSTLIDGRDKASRLWPKSDTLCDAASSVLYHQTIPTANLAVVACEYFRKCAQPLRAQRFLPEFRKCEIIWVQSYGAAKFGDDISLVAAANSENTVQFGARLPPERRAPSRR